VSENTLLFIDFSSFGLVAEGREITYDDTSLAAAENQNTITSVFGAMVNAGMKCIQLTYIIPVFKTSSGPEKDRSVVHFYDQWEDRIDVYKQPSDGTDDSTN
jgi:hypothetical protein